MEPLLELQLELPNLLVGVVRAHGVRPGPSPAGLETELAAVVERVGGQESHPHADLKKGIRDVLRTAGYKPSGRGKPASEYLGAMARKGEFPRIDVLVDINNLLSLDTGLPISVLDLGKFSGRPTLRFGTEDERYVFNTSGQEIGLKGLMVVCDGDVPRGTPVKDSMATKVGPGTASVLVVIYGSAAVLDEAVMAGYTRRFAALLEQYAGATETTIWVGQPGSGPGESSAP